MSSYTPRDPGILAIVAAILAATLIAGLAIGRLTPGRIARASAWLVTVGATAGVTCSN
ncbi:MAG: hypothetical protein ACH37Z_17225 [Anaerolineae bacterium]